VAAADDVRGAQRKQRKACRQPWQKKNVSACTFCFESAAASTKAALRRRRQMMYAVPNARSAKPAHSHGKKNVLACTFCFASAAASTEAALWRRQIMHALPNARSAKPAGSDGSVHWRVSSQVTHSTHAQCLRH
jgi:hypothetical protein